MGNQKKTGKRFFVTGGAGFIANRTIDRILVAGNPNQHKVVVYDNFHRDTLMTSDLADHRDIEIVRGDVLDAERVLESLQGSDVVIHAAGIAGVDTVVKNPIGAMEVNMIGTANVLRAAYESNVSDRFIDFSSSEIFGSMAFKSTEDDYAVVGPAGNARWTYAVSKLAGEHLSKAYHYQFGLPTVTVRPFNIYGPGQTGEGAIKNFIAKALRNETMFINGDGTQIRAWCYIADFVECLMLCVDREEAVGESFNIGNSRAVFTILELANLVRRALNSKSEIVHVPALSADVSIRVPGVGKAEEVLGFKAETDLEEGIVKTAEWIQSRT